MILLSNVKKIINQEINENHFQIFSRHPTQVKVTIFSKLQAKPERSEKVCQVLLVLANLLQINLLFTYSSSSLFCLIKNFNFV